jgi:hypothetical protein
VYLDAHRDHRRLRLRNRPRFLRADTFGTAWFVASLTVYGGLFASAIVLALVDPGRVEATQTQAEPAPETEAETAEGVEVLDREVLYRTRTGHLLRVRFANGKGPRSLLFAVTRDRVHPITAIEARLDQVDIDPPTIDDERDIEKALERRAGQDGDGPGPERVEVTLDNHKTLYETGTGRVVEATYTVEGTQRTSLFVVTEDDVVPIGDVEAQLDETDVDELPVEAENVFEQALEEREVTTEPEGAMSA